MSEPVQRETPAKRCAAGSSRPKAKAAAELCCGDEGLAPEAARAAGAAVAAAAEEEEAEEERVPSPPPRRLADEEKLTYEEKLWREYGGGALEPVLASGAVALLDAQWIITHAEAGGVLTHRQALPKEAFLSLGDLIEASSNGLPILQLSCPWLTKGHPDPNGENLRRVAKALKALTRQSFVRDGVRLGVFWDYGSLHQHPDPANGVVRTEEQNALFKQGLACLGMFYSHNGTTVLRLTKFPEGYKKEDQPEDANVSDYCDRGWCFTESAMASLTKDFRKSLDLGRMCDDKEYKYSFELIEDCTKGGGRRPPLLPSAFAAELETKSFTNGKDDKPLVKRLYEAAFQEQFGKATELRYNFLGWGDAEVTQLAEVLASGAAPRLEKLILHGNKIGDEGCKALAAALKEGAAPRLKELELQCNNIGDEGCKALAAALGKNGALPLLKSLVLHRNGIGDEGLRVLATALEQTGAVPQLQDIELDANFSAKAIMALAATLRYQVRGSSDSSPHYTTSDFCGRVCRFSSRGTASRRGPACRAVFDPLMSLERTGCSCGQVGATLRKCKHGQWTQKGGREARLERRRSPGASASLSVSKLASI